jgi:methylisocitrate lyase
MPYLVADDLPTEPAGVRFRKLLERPGILGMPGTHNGQAALQAKAAGFEAAYLSGAAMTASMGLPDLGIITVDEACFFIRQVARSGLPVLVDGDTGYGEALNVMHMVRAFEAAGAAAVHIEDQLLPKKCGHLNDKKLADAHDMAAKIAAARKARRHLHLIARTDAAASEGIEGAVARARLYLQAGADAIFPEALTNADMFRAFSEAMPGVKLLANMTEFGRTPFFTAAEFEAMGYRMVIWPVSSLRVANKAQEELYAAIKRDGGTQRMVERMQTRAELYATIGYHDYEALDASIVRTVLPNGPPDRTER